MQKRLKAYSIIEVSIALLIIGITSISILQLSRGFYAQYKKQLTVKRQQIVLKALARFATEYECLPYPCDPSLNHVGRSVSAPNEENLGKVRYIGTIPWATLKLPQSYAFDGNGNLMTYIMHPLLGKRSDKPTRIAFKTQANPRPNLYASLSNVKKDTIKPKDVAPSFCLSTFSSGTEVFDSITLQPDLLIPIYIPPHGSIINLRMHDPYNKNNADENTYEIFFSDYHSGETWKKSIGRVSDCTAIILISHGTTGGHYDYQGKRTEIKLNEYYTKLNAADFKTFDVNKPHSLNIPFALNSNDPKFDQTITYSTRFNLVLYGGPRCKPHYINREDNISNYLNSIKNWKHESADFENDDQWLETNDQLPTVELSKVFYKEKI